MNFHCCLFDRDCREDIRLTRSCVVTAGRWSRTFRLPGRRLHMDAVTIEPCRTWTSTDGSVWLSSSHGIQNPIYCGSPMLPLWRPEWIERSRAQLP